MKYLIFLAALVTASAFAQVPIEPSSENLELCARPILQSHEKRYAHHVLNNECARQKEKWVAACMALWTSKGFTAETVCAGHLGRISAALDTEVEKSLPAKIPKPNALQLANEDLLKNRPLPGLPNLNAPVFLVETALICESLRGLENPNISAAVLTKACVINRQLRRVQIVIPTTSDSYLESHVFRSVRVTWRADSPSIGNVFSGWVRISSLRN